MQVFIYYYSQLGFPRDEIESEIEHFLGTRGAVTGGGGGVTGGNIDLEIETDEAERVVADLRHLLRSLHLPRDTVLDVEGQRTKLYDNT
jgi:hypothetical protein